MGRRCAFRPAVLVSAAFLAGSVLVLVAATPTRAEEEVPAEARRAAETLVANLNRALFDGGADPGEKRALVEREVRRRLDLGAMAASALGPLSDSFTREQYASFAAEFARYLTHVYAQRLARADQEIEIVEETWHPERRVATFRTLGSQRARLPFPRRQQGPASERARTDLHFRERHGEWRVVAVVIEGVSVEQNFRSQFESVLAREDADALIADLDHRNDELAAKNPFEPSR